MVDTIVIRLNDTHYHTDIWRFLLEQTLVEKRKMMTLVDWVQNNPISPHITFPEIEFGDTGERVFQVQPGHMHITSSHYFCAYILRKEYIQFNFSIPKYLYGNNIAQFVLPGSDPSFRIYQHQNFMDQIDVTYDRLMVFIRTFFEENFDGMPLKWEEIEIRRIDICFNQIFDSKQSALRYLQLQRRLEKPYSRLESNNFNNYATGISYVGGGYSFKIYHKGTEYKTKGDLKEHSRINRLLLRDFERLTMREKKIREAIEDSFADRNEHWKIEYLRRQAEMHQKVRKWDSKLVFDTDFLQAMADRILRYEMTFHKKEISRIYKGKVFQHKNPQWRAWKKLFLELDNISEHGNKPQKIDPDYRKWYKQMRGSLRKIHDFYPFPTEAIKMHEGSVGYYEHEIEAAYFSRKLFKELVSKFWTFVEAFQVKEMPQVEILIKKIHEQNRDIQKRRERMGKAKDKIGRNELATFGKLLNYHKMRGHIMSIAHWGSLDAWKKNECMDVYPRTFRRWKADLKRIGIDERSVFDKVPFRANLDLEEYYIIEREDYPRLKYSLRTREI